ncbi:alpha/beta family hydrolase [Thalassobius sp. MITS945101]|uniref:alpha/beta family hydrolase n=1 Tax=Thalassobius sp. MITS945101 TaxID=3096994 RepID=UPI00399BF153
MSEIDFLIDGPAEAPTLLLAHGAGAGMDTPFMQAIAEGVAKRGLRCVRFEFAYMAQRRQGGSKRPPPKVEKLQEEYRSVIAQLATQGPLFIGGKSMGGRVASLIAEDLYQAGQLQGLICLGYPFHPSGKPEKLRTAHLADLQTPTLICQGSRDAFGTAEEVVGYDLSSNIQIQWLEDGNHDLKPRQRISGFTHTAHLETTAAAIAAWVEGQLR